MRNDLGRVCRAGTVRVPEHRRLESYRNVHHLVSVVTGELAAGRDTVDLVRAAFPAGSITGCPKRRAMEIIDALETRTRHVYCGSIGYLGFDDTADLSVAIRTATVMNGTASWSVGGGIVADSDPAAEYAESLHKGRTLAAAVGAAPGAEAGPWCWHDGAIVPERQAAVPVTDLGLLRGFGLFETMRADHGRVPLLADHLARLAASWRALMPSPPPDLDWATIVARVIAANGLDDVPTRVRLVATRGTRSAAPWDHHLTIMAGRYVHRLAAYGVAALALATYPQPRQTPLAAHKTLSYIYYNQAGSLGARPQLPRGPDPQPRRDGLRGQQHGPSGGAGARGDAARVARRAAERHGRGRVPSARGVGLHGGHGAGAPRRAAGGRPGARHQRHDGRRARGHAR